jgi:putative tryptophan/tyrosine transport system substrate-binding protein
MDRRRFLLTSLAGALAAPLAAGAQAGRVPRIGWLGTDPAAHRREVLLQDLRDLGYVEGRNIEIEYRFAKGNMERLPAVAAELVARNVDVIVAVSQPAVQAAQQATRTIPIVMFGVGDPVSTGLVANLARPGGNVTGLSQLSPELSTKRLALVREIIPEVSRVAVLSNPTNPSNPPQIRDIKAAAKALGVGLQVLEIRSSQDLDSAFLSAAQVRAGAFVTLDDLLIFNERMRIVALAAKSRLPGMYGWPDFPQAGGLISYGVDFRDMYRQAAIFVDKILKGAKPADLPVEQPTKFELVINLKTAKALGLTIPPSLLARADQVIE